MSGSNGKRTLVEVHQSKFHPYSKDEEVIQSSGSKGDKNGYVHRSGGDGGDGSAGTSIYSSDDTNVSHQDGAIGGLVHSSPLPHVKSTPTFEQARDSARKQRRSQTRTISTMSSLCPGPNHRQKKIYSVSFQDHGFSYRETSVLDANARWGISFAQDRFGAADDEEGDGVDESDVVSASRRREEEVSKFAAAASSPSVPIPTTPCRLDSDAPVRRSINFDQSKSLDSKPGYASIIATTPPSNRPSPVVFCIHGNKFGVAHCCDDLWPTSGDADLSHGHEGDDDKAPLVPSDGHKHRQHRQRSQDELHCHSVDMAANNVDKRARRKLIIASILCLFFMVVEIVGGVLANSLAIATDAAHLLTDFASFMISLFSLWVASRPATRSMSFGWHRAEVIGATVSVLLIWVVTGVLVYAAVQRISTMAFELDPTVMLITSGIGVVVNIIMGCSLHQHGHTHGGGGGGDHGHSHGGSSSGDGHGHSHGAGESHGHSHGGAENDVEGQSRRASIATQEAEAARKKRENINVRAAFIHVIGDFIQSLGVFIAALVIYFYPHLIIIDPICTFIFSILVLATTIRILRDTMNVLMEGIPRDISFTVVQETFQSVEGIIAVHNLRIWGLTTDKTALAAHLVIAPGSNFQQILQEASTRIRAKYDFYEMTLQVEEFQEDMEDCTQCQGPE